MNHFLARHQGTAQSSRITAEIQEFPLEQELSDHAEPEASLPLQRPHQDSEGQGTGDTQSQRIKIRLRQEQEVFKKIRSVEDIVCKEATGVTEFSMNPNLTEEWPPEGSISQVAVQVELTVTSTAVSPTEVQ